MSTKLLHTFWEKKHESRRTAVDDHYHRKINKNPPQFHFQFLSTWKAHWVYLVYVLPKTSKKHHFNRPRNDRFRRRDCVNVKDLLHSYLHTKKKTIESSAVERIDNQYCIPVSFDHIYTYPPTGNHNNIARSKYCSAADRRTEIFSRQQEC